MDTPARPVAFEPIRPRRAFEEICAQVRDQLAVGALKAGDKLPAERELAQQFGVSRNAVREALRTLEFAGIVEIRKGTKGGAFIREADPESMTRVIEDLLHLGSISLSELTEARQHIQDIVVRLACERATEAELQALKANIDATEAVIGSGDQAARFECTLEFYRLLAAASHNAALVLIVDPLTETLMKYLRARVPADARLHPDLVEARRRFLKLLVARDADATTLEMRTHLMRLHRLLIKDDQ